VQVPRKSYRDYQADIYPDTAGPAAAMGPLDWLEGAAVAAPRISLNPAQRPQAGLAIKNLPKKTQTTIFFLGVFWVFLNFKFF
jgi:hypothetical protein